MKMCLCRCGWKPVRDKSREGEGGCEEDRKGLRESRWEVRRQANA